MASSDPGPKPSRNPQHKSTNLNLCSIYADYRWPAHLNLHTPAQISREIGFSLHKPARKKERRHTPEGMG